MRKLIALVIAAIVVMTLQCHSQYHPLESADRCACRVGEYCKVSLVGDDAARECLPLPTTCGAHPTCGCLGGSTDACRDDDGRLALLPPRSVASCQRCSKEELCIEGMPSSPVCRVLPPQCESTPSCDCFLKTRHASNLACSDRDGRIVASLK